VTLLPLPAHLGDALPPAPTADVLTFLARRRSASANTLTEPGPSPIELDDLLHVAARVPDHGKLTPWRFILLEGEAKAAFADKLAALAQAKGDHRAVTKLGKLRTPPMGVAVIFSPVQAPDIPEWEQTLSAGAVCTNLLLAAGAMGYGANWITDWYAYDAEATALLGLKAGEKVAGFIFIGTTTEPPLERIRPDVKALTSVWSAG
jgi:nitroreductase